MHNIWNPSKYFKQIRKLILHSGICYTKFIGQCCKGESHMTQDYIRIAKLEHNLKNWPNKILATLALWIWQNKQIAKIPDSKF